MGVKVRVCVSRLATTLPCSPQAVPFSFYVTLIDAQARRIDGSRTQARGLRPTSATYPCSAQPYDFWRKQPRAFENRQVPTIHTASPNTPRNLAAMLYLVGLGLADEKDVTVRGLEIIKKAERVYLESYTAVLLVDKEVLVSWPLWNEGDIANHHAVGIVLWPRSNHCRPRNGRIIQRRHPRRRRQSRRSIPGCGRSIRVRRITPKQSIHKLI